MSYGTGVNAPSGFKPSQYLNGSLWTGQQSHYLILPTYASSIFTYDLVALHSDGTINKATAGDTNPVIGAFLGCTYTDTTGNQIYSPYWAANTNTRNSVYATAFITDDPWILYDIQASNVGNVAPTSATVSIQQAVGGTNNYFMNGNLGLAGGGGNGITNPTDGSTITGLSGMYLDINSVATGNAGRQVKIIRLTPVPGNLSGVLYNNALVLINNDNYKGGTGTVGV